MTVEGNFIVNDRVLRQEKETIGLRFPGGTKKGFQHMLEPLD